MRSAGITEEFGTSGRGQRAAQRSAAAEKAAPLELGSIPNAYATRRVPREHMRWLIEGSRAPQGGDLVLAKVEGLGHHTRLQLPDGGRRHLFEGDAVIVAYGDRYAPQQFEAEVPRDLSPCELVAGGGIAARVLSQHARIRRGATRIRPLGLVAAEEHGPVLNLRNYALPELRSGWSGEIPTLAIAGTAMDSGKTTTAAYLTRGLRRAGLRVGYAKVTGTGAGGDPSLVRDAGADPVLDFGDAGYASTYRVPLKKLKRAFCSLVAHLEHAGAEVILLEVADGLFQPETAALLASDTFSDHTHALLFAAGDAMGAAAGIHWLRERDLSAIGLSGALEAAPLQAQEAQAATQLPVFGRDELADPYVAGEILDDLESRMRGAR